MTYWGYLIGYGYLAMLIGIAELLSRRTAINREVMRKILHCLIGLEWLVLYYCFAGSWQIVIIPTSFIVVNVASYRFKLFHSIERTQDNHLGTVFYALAMTAMSIAVVFNPNFMLPFGISVACLSFGDAAAALMGQYLRPKVAVFRKSLWGVIGCLLFAFAAQIALFALLGQPFNFTYFLAIAVVAALSEVISNKGTDNLFVCLWCFLWSYALFFNPPAIQNVLMCFMGFMLAGVCINTRSFTVVASVVAGAMLAAVGILGGWFPFLYIISAYAVIYLAEHYIKQAKYKETRKVVQILANGVCAMAMVVAYYFTRYQYLLIAYAVAIAESLSDSFAGVVGTAYAKRVYDLVSHKPVDKGLSGGVSLEGTLAGLAVSALTAVVCGFVFGWNWYLCVVAFFPFLGMLLDSLLGATVQYKKLCVVCGAVCECTSHCSRPTERHSGFAIFSNGMVNLITNMLTTGATVLVLYFVYRA